MNLLRAEWRRFFARRFTQTLLLVVLVLLALVGAGVAAGTHRASPAAVAQAEQEAAQVRQHLRTERQACEDAQSGRTAPDAPANDRYTHFPPGVTCADAFDPSQVTTKQYLPHSFSFAEETASLVEVFAALLGLFGFAAGASFVGAEFATGGMTTLLLWRPRRVRVLLTKLAALLLGVTASGVVVGAAWLGALWEIAATRGRTDGVTPGVLRSLGLVEARAFAFALAAAAIGFAVATLGRNTVTALAIGIGYIVVVELGGRMVFDVTNTPKPERWFLSSYALAWLEKSRQFFDVSACRYASGACSPTRWSITMGPAAAIGAVLLVVTVGGALVAFRRRDVA
ncbi:MAG TPA: ABC transporter permease subunit [Micromonosporaceae bacterium]